MRVNRKKDVGMIIPRSHSTRRINLPLINRLTKDRETSQYIYIIESPFAELMNTMSGLNCYKSIFFITFTWISCSLKFLKESKKYRVLENIVLSTYGTVFLLISELFPSKLPILLRKTYMTFEFCFKFKEYVKKFKKICGIWNLVTYTVFK